MSLTHQHLQSVCLYLPVVLKLFPLVIGEFVAAFLPTHFLTVLVQFWRQLRGSCEGGYIHCANESQWVLVTLQEIFQSLISLMTGEFHIIYSTYNHGQFLFLRLYSFRLIFKSPLFFFLGGYARSVVAHPSAWKLPSLTFKNLRMFNTRLTLFRRYSDVIQSEIESRCIFRFPGNT